VLTDLLLSYEPDRDPKDEIQPSVARTPSTLMSTDPASAANAAITSRRYASFALGPLSKAIADA
jgi:hypothetical protein